MKTKLILLLSIIFLALGCQDDDVVTPRTGDIYVTVYSVENNTYSPLKGANVYTVPVSQQAITDEFGTALLKDIKKGSYQVYAESSTIGLGKEVVLVSKDSLSKVSIYIVKGASSGIIPDLNVILPAQPANFSLNENIVFSLSATDEDTPSNELVVEIVSDIDGLLLKTNPDVSNNVRFETANLSRGTHEITITVTDTDGYKAIKVFEVSTIAPGPIELIRADIDGGKVQLLWNKYTLPDFKQYSVYRTTNLLEEGQLIGSLNSIDSLSFTDKNPPFETAVFYYVRVANTEGLYRNSNNLKVLEPAGKVYNYLVSDAVHHPNKPIIYIIDDLSQRLIAIDYINHIELNSIDLAGKVGKIDIGDNGYGVELYVPNSTGFIHIYNASTLEIVSSINTGLSNSCVATNGKGFVVAGVRPSPWWEQPIRTYSRSSGTYLSGNGDFDGDFIRFIPNSNNIITITTSVSPTDMEYLELDDSGSILAHYDDNYHSDHPLDARIFRISPNAEYVVTSASGAVYSATSSMTYKGIIDRGMLEFSDFAFSGDGNTIYAGTSNRTSLQIVKYPELTRVNEIITKGYPMFLFNFNGEIISISLAELYSSYFGIERIKIE